MKKKVLFLTNIPSPYRVSFFNELGKSVNLTVLFERENSRERHEKWQSEVPINYNSVFLNGFKIGANKSLSFQVFKYLKNEKYDEIVISGYSTPTGLLSILILKGLNRNFTISVDGGMIKKEKKTIKNVKKFFISSASKWLSPSDDASNYLLHYGAIKESIFQYPFTSLYSKEILTKNINQDLKAKLKSELNIKEKYAIISVGRVIPLKGFDLLLNAINVGEDEIGIYIIGGKPYKELDNIIRERNLQTVHFIDFLNKAELFKYYRAGDLFVLPTRGDVWGLVINESMANGLPVITTDACIAGKELVKNGVNGFLVESESALEINEVIYKIIKDEQFKKTLGDNSLNIIKGYSFEKMAQMVLKSFEKRSNNGK